jgi:hypothetical protein
MVESLQVDKVDQRDFKARSGLALKFHGKKLESQGAIIDGAAALRKTQTWRSNVSYLSLRTGRHAC